MTTVTRLEPDQVPEAELRVVLVGAGRMAGHHANVISSGVLPARIVAVVDPDRDAGAALASRFPDAISASSLGQALDRVTADVVHICSPPSTHPSVAIEALEAGCHVYVEKPFANSGPAASAVLETARRRQLAVCAGHQLLFESPARRARDLIPMLGKIQHIESYFSFRPVRGAGGQAPVSDVDQLLDILPHPVYLLLAFLEYSEPKGPSTVTALEVGKGTVHVLIRRGDLTGALVVTVTGRPIENFVRVVGTSGSVTGDFVRGVLVRHLGAGTSGIDKLFAPYRTARHLAFGTTRSMARRFLARQKSYPGLTEIFAEFYSCIQHGTPQPVTSESILDTVRVQERVAEVLSARQAETLTSGSAPRLTDGVLVTGGTGMLGRKVVQMLRATGRPVRVLARRPPADWNHEPGVQYAVGDLSLEMKADWLDGISSVVHCAAATSGGWEEHQRASVDATERLIRTMASAGIENLIHVSSLAVVEEPRGTISDESPLLAEPRSAGPYAWGKLESERVARELGDEFGMSVSIVRPAAIIDYDALEPPGRLGRRLGNLFVAVGGRSEKLGVVDLTFCARAITALLDRADSVQTVNLLDPELPSRKHLVASLKQGNPDLRAVWIPRWAVHPLNWTAWLAQKALRPGSDAINIATVFENRRYDTSSARRLIDTSASDSSERQQ